MDEYSKLAGFDVDFFVYARRIQNEFLEDRDCHDIESYWEKHGHAGLARHYHAELEESREAFKRERRLYGELVRALPSLDDLKALTQCIDRTTRALEATFAAWNAN